MGNSSRVSRNRLSHGEALYRFFSRTWWVMMESSMLGVLVLVMTAQGLTMRDLPLLGAILFALAAVVEIKAVREGKLSEGQKTIAFIVAMSALMGCLTSLGVFILR